MCRVPNPHHECMCRDGDGGCDFSLTILTQRGGKKKLTRITTGQGRIEPTHLRAGPPCATGGEVAGWEKRNCTGVACWRRGATPQKRPAMETILAKETAKGLPGRGPDHKRHLYQPHTTPPLTRTEGGLPLKTPLGGAHGRTKKRARTPHVPRHGGSVSFSRVKFTMGAALICAPVRARRSYSGAQ
jgi:hypothetical protein